jgi:hypothetical protein
VMLIIMVFRWEKRITPTHEKENPELIQPKL